MEQDLLDKTPLLIVHITYSTIHIYYYSEVSITLLKYIVQDFMGSLKGQFLFKLGKPQQWLGRLKATKIRVVEVLLQEFYNFEKD